MADQPTTDTQQDAQQEKERDTLIALLAAAFALSATAIHQLAALIYTARIQTYQDVYQAIVRTLGASLPADWDIPDLVLEAQRDASLLAAQSVANSLAADMQAEAERLTNNWLATHADLPNPFADAQHTLATQMQAVAQQRAQWKAAQVGQHETAQAQARATRDAVSDLQDGALTDDATGDPIQPSLWAVQVIPDSSSGDAACAEYAGNTYPLDSPEADEALDAFPAHINCIHSAIIVPAADALTA